MLTPRAAVCNYKLSKTSPQVMSNCLFNEEGRCLIEMLKFIQCPEVVLHIQVKACQGFIPILSARVWHYPTVENKSSAIRIIPPIWRVFK
jgi:hypothetical protein